MKKTARPYQPGEYKFPLPNTIPNQDAFSIRRIAIANHVPFFDEPQPTKEEINEADRMMEGLEKVMKQIRRTRKSLSDLRELSIEQRYTLEYWNHIYASMKYGLDRGLSEGGFLGMKVADYGTVVEIGGGNGPFCRGIKREEPGKRTIVADIVESPDLAKVDIGYMHGDILSDHDSDQMVIVGKEEEKPPLYVMSYFLDRVPDQKKALDNFARILRDTGGEGLITVCLPPNESDFSQFDKERWLTTSGDAAEDFERICDYCRLNGLSPVSMGITSHVGTSLDGFEVIPAYCLRLSAKR